jgi:hypothetical protein
MSATLNLPALSADYADIRLGLYCLPLVGDILRIASIVNTLDVVKERTLTKDEVMLTRIDISKWVIGAIPAAILALASPLTGVITAVVSIAAIVMTCYEQLSLCTSLHSSSISAISFLSDAL